MNKTIAIIVAILVILGGGYYLYTQAQSGDANPAAQTTTTDSAMGNTDTGATAGSSDTISSTGKFTGSLAELARQNGSYQCTFSTDASGTTLKGTVYLSAGQVRGEFKSVAQGVTVQSNMLQLNGYVYTWTNMTPAGVKVKVSPTGSATTYDSSGQYANQTASYNYDCQGWQPDPTVFAFPQGVTFTDATQ